MTLSDFATDKRNFEKQIREELENIVIIGAFIKSYRFHSNRQTISNFVNCVSRSVTITGDVPDGSIPLSYLYYDKTEHSGVIFSNIKYLTQQANTYID